MTRNDEPTRDGPEPAPSDLEARQDRAGAPSGRDASGRGGEGDRHGGRPQEGPRRSRVRVRPAGRGADDRPCVTGDDGSVDSKRAERPSPEELVWRSRNASRVVYVEFNALRDIAAHARSSPRIEVGGFLIGRCGLDGDGPFTVVDRVLRAFGASGTSVELELPPETWVELHAELDRTGSSAHCVGWYHTHPSLGLFLSGHDQFLHRSWFPSEEQVAIVADPTLGKAGVFVTRGGELFSPSRPESCVFLPSDEGPGAETAGPGQLPLPPPEPTDIIVTVDEKQPRRGRLVMLVVATVALVILLLGGRLVFGGAGDQGGDRDPRSTRAPTRQRGGAAATPTPDASPLPPDHHGVPGALPEVRPSADPCVLDALCIDIEVDSTTNPTRGELVFVSGTLCAIDDLLFLDINRSAGDLQQHETSVPVRGLVTGEGLRENLPFIWEWCDGPSELLISDAGGHVASISVPVPTSCT